MAKRFIHSLIPVLVLMATTVYANAQKWSEMDVRGFKPGMTFPDVKAHIEKEWPQARVNINYRSLKISTEKFEYLYSIDFHNITPDETETFNLVFLPPPSISVGKDGSTVRRIGRSITYRDKTFEKNHLVEQLLKKHGELTYIDQTNARWIFDENQNLISKTAITQSIEKKENECKSIRENWDSLNKQMVELSGRGPLKQEMFKKLREFDESHGACLRQTELLKSCSRRMQPRQCPYTLDYQMRELSNAKGLFNGYGVDLHGIPMDEREKENLVKIKKELEAKVRGASSTDTKL